MKFLLEIQCDNSAFDGAPGVEVARILAAIAQIIATTPERNEWRLCDFNGNGVGKAQFKGD